MSKTPSPPLSYDLDAPVAELADAQGLGPCIRWLWVQVPPGAQINWGLERSLIRVETERDIFGEDNFALKGPGNRSR